MTAANSVREPPARPSPSPGARRPWAFALLAAGLLGLSVGGMMLMEAFQDRANAEVWRLCETLTYTGHLRWSHGYGAWLPIATVATAGLAAAAAVVVMSARWGRARGARVLAVAVLPLALLMLLLSGITLDEFYAFPGGDISTVGTSPCGVG